MTEYELMEHAQMAYGNAIASFTLIFTILSAYLVVAYFVGKKLTSSQVTIVNLFFTLSVVVTIFGELGFCQLALILRSKRSQLIPPALQYHYIPRCHCTWLSWISSLRLSV